ncbi:MAG: hypothetical protein ACOCX9_06050 [Spirochaetota bacterium]
MNNCKAVIILILIFVFSLAACSNKPTIGSSPRESLVKKYFQDDNTYIIIARGYPKPGLPEMQAINTAQEAALTNAQVIARQSFDDSVDVIKAGRVKEYENRGNHVVVTYVVILKDLRDHKK